MQVGGEKQTNIDVGLYSGPPGTERQRGYARKLVQAAKERDITAYVHDATSEGEQASIAGLLKWLGTGRHGNLKGEYEWYTPAHILEAVHELMGGIDIDPASNEFANQTVRAKTFYTEEQDGLLQEWPGRVFLNPPFAHPIVKHFAEKLMESFASNKTEQAVWLSNACVDVGWWQDLASIGPICFPRGRLKFYGPDGAVQPPTLGQSIIYLGHQTEQFCKIFRSFGVVVVNENHAEKFA